MSLGQQMAPWLPNLRHYAALVMNDEVAGDAAVHRMLNAIVSDPEALSRELPPKVAVYKAFEQSLADNDLDPTDRAREIFKGNDDLSPHVRKVILLISVEGFTAPEAAVILDKTAKEVDEAISATTKPSSTNNPASILIVEPQPDIANYLKAMSEDMGHSVIAIADSVDAALAIAETFLPDIVISETRLASGSIFHLLGALIPICDPDVIIITGDPDDLLYAKSPPAVAALLTKPVSAKVFKSTLEKVIAGHIPPARPIPSKSDEMSQKHLEVLSAMPVPFAPTAKVSAGTVSFVERPPQASTSLDHLNILRVDHAEDAERVAVLGHNLGSSFSSRMNKIAFLLSGPLTEESMLRVANQAQSLTEFTRSADEEMLPSVAADIKSVILSLQQFSKQFPAWRAFLAATEDPANDEPNTRHEVANLAQALQSVPGLLSTEVSDALTEASSDISATDHRSTSYLAGLVHNIFSAVAGYVMKRGVGIADSFHKKLDEEIGNALASGTTTLFIAASTPLLAMASALPSQWAFAGPAVASVRLAQKLASK